MHVLVDAANNKNFVIVANRLRSEKLLRLLKRAIHTLDLANFCIEREAVRYPAIVTSEDQNFGVVEREATHRIAGRPVVFAVYEDHRLPLLLFEVAIAVKALNTI